MPLLLEGPVKLIIAIVIVITSIILGRVFGTFTQKILLELEIQRIFKRLKIPVEELAGTIIKYAIYIAGIIFALSRLGLGTQIINITLLIILAIIALEIILSIKDSAGNMVAGFSIYKKKYFKLGDEVTINNIVGSVEKINLFETKLRTKEGFYIVPNSLMLKECLKVKELR